MKFLPLNKSIFLPHLPYLAKCVIGVIICYILYKEFPQYPFYWAIVSVVIAISPDNSNRLAYDRMKANILGCSIGLCLYSIHIPTLLLLCLGIVATICVGIALNLMSTLRSAMAALIIILIHEEQVRQWYLPVERVLCVIAGCLVALLVSLVFNRVGQQFKKIRPLSDEQPDK